MTISTKPTLETPAAGVLAQAPVISLVLYVNDLAESREFYERRLGLRAVEHDDDSVTYHAGGITLSLNIASKHGVTLSGRHDDASDIVFLVDDFDTVHDALTRRGVEFVRRRTYDVGAVTDFYDPNGHRLMIYQPSEESLFSWPSGRKLQDVWRDFGRGGADLIGPPSKVESKEQVLANGLDGKPVVYLFMFVPDSASAFAFYHDALGLQSMEAVHCCNPECPPDEKGIVKYDAGNLLLTTHHIHHSPVVDDSGTVYSALTSDPAHLGGIVPVFEVEDVAAAMARLSAHGVGFAGDIVRSRRGKLATFSADAGHTFLLFEPNPVAQRRPGRSAGKKLQGIAEARS
jgi:catechol 2,3-dioxygenase-like lactoylglutathione lyase family enzyme